MEISAERIREERRGEEIRRKGKMQEEKKMHHVIAKTSLVGSQTSFSRQSESSVPGSPRSLFHVEFEPGLIISQPPHPSIPCLVIHEVRSALYSPSPRVSELVSDHVRYQDGLFPVFSGFGSLFVCLLLDDAIQGVCDMSLVAGRVGWLGPNFLVVFSNRCVAFFHCLLAYLFT